MGKSKKIKKEEYTIINIRIEPPIGTRSIKNSKRILRERRFGNLIRPYFPSFYTYSWCPHKNIELKVNKDYFTIKELIQLRKVLESKEAKRLGVKSFRMRDLTKITTTEKIYEQIHASKNWK